MSNSKQANVLDDCSRQQRWRNDQPAGTTLTCMFGLLALVKAVAQSCKDAMALPPRQACVYTAAEFTMPALSHLDTV